MCKAELEAINEVVTIIKSLDIVKKNYVIVNLLCKAKLPLERRFKPN